MPPKRASKPSNTNSQNSAERMGRVRTHTTKQQETLDQAAAKVAMKTKKATTKALREHQANEEAVGFVGTGKDVESEDPTDDENEPHGDTSFTSQTVGTNQVYKNPNLVRRVPPKDPNQALQEISNEPKQRNMNLVRRVGHAPERQVLFYHSSDENLDTDSTQGMRTPMPARFQPNIDNYEANFGGHHTQSQRLHYRSNNENYEANFAQDSQPYGRHHTQSKHSMQRDTPSTNDLDADQYDNGGHHHDDPLPSSSSATRKRNAPLEPTTDVLTMQVVKKVKTESGGGSKVKARDFEGLVQAVLDVSYHHFRCRVCTERPYLDRIEEQEFATMAWTKGCRMKGVSIAFDEDMFKLVTARLSQVRGQVKTKVRLHSESGFKLESSTDLVKIRKTRERVEDLKDRMAFAYKNPSLRKGIFENPIIQKVVNSVWFADQNSEGVEYSEYFQAGIPLVTIALILTAIENVLDEWQTGNRHAIQFSEALYANKFRGYLKTLERFANRTKEADILPKIQRRLLKNARRHANVPDETTEVVALTDIDFDAAIGEWEERGDDSGASGDEST